jgi:hypothetical protein
MAATDSTTPTSSSEADNSYKSRSKLANVVVVGSFLTLFFLVGTLIVLALTSNGTANDTAKNAFNTVMPVLAGWVGTVLAFYFSAASQERITQTLDKAIAQSNGGPGPSAPVSTNMIPYSSITGLQKLDETPPEKIMIKDLQAQFNATLPNGGKVTRLLFVDKGVFKYVLHVATLNAYLVPTPSPASTNPPSTGDANSSPSAPINRADLNFADMLNDAETLRQISQLVVFVPASATLGDAKAALDKVNGAQDIIVTGSGNPTDPMSGWLSNVDLIKALQVN